MATGYVWHELYAWHDTGTGSLYNANALAGMQPIPYGIHHPDTKRRFHELVAVSGLLDELIRIPPRPATEEELLAVHSERHIEDMRRQSEQPKGGDAGGGGSPFGVGGYEIARLSAGGAVVLMEEVLRGNVENGYALINPPGHHASFDRGMGMCMFNNLAVAIRYAQREFGVERIAVVDWDVHHGNGTQAVFYEDPSVLTISIHQEDCFPADSGRIHESGEGEGEGYAVNIPLPPGTGDDGYVYAMEQVVLPVLHKFKPEVIVVASGLDANALDPLGRQMVTSRAFRRMTELVMGAAAELCGGRIVMTQEGGYSPHYVPWCGLAVLEALAGTTTLDDGFLGFLTRQAGHELKLQEKELVDSVVRMLEL